MLASRGGAPEAHYAVQRQMALSLIVLLIPQFSVVIGRQYDRTTQTGIRKSCHRAAARRAGSLAGQILAPLTVDDDAR
jgi:hypothetical protein